MARIGAHLNSAVVTVFPLTGASPEVAGVQSAPFFPEAEFCVFGRHVFIRESLEIADERSCVGHSGFLAFCLVRKAASRER